MTTLHLSPHAPQGGSPLNLPPLPERPDEPFRLVSAPAEYWNIDRVAREFEVAPATIRHWIRDGKLPEPLVKKKGKWLFGPEQFAEILRRRRETGTP
jgi:hypothetical protein